MAVAAGMKQSSIPSFLRTPDGKPLCFSAGIFFRYFK
jgi:hypothetical protein